MARLIYFTPTSLDGCIAEQDYAWSAPDDEGFAFINELERPVGTYLYGRRMYQTLVVWQTPEVIPGLTPAMREFARIWQAADKILYSRSLAQVETPKTRLAREFDPIALGELKHQSDKDISVGGPTLAAQAIKAGIVDEIHLLVVPMLLGGGIRVLPRDVSIQLERLDMRRFANGHVYLRYRTRT